MCWLNLTIITGIVLQPVFAPVNVFAGNRAHPVLWFVLKCTSFFVCLLYAALVQTAVGLSTYHLLVCDSHVNILVLLLSISSKHTWHVTMSDSYPIAALGAIFVITFNMVMLYTCTKSVFNRSTWRRWSLTKVNCQLLVNAVEIRNQLGPGGRWVATVTLENILNEYKYLQIQVVLRVRS